MAVITISRQLGSYGTRIAAKLKEDLNYDYIDKRVLEDYLVQCCGLSEQKFEKFDEKRPGFADVFSAEKDKYLHYMKTTIYNTAKKGNCILIGRGGQVLLQDIPGVLHIRIIAPDKLRCSRIREQSKNSESYARRILRHSDHDRAGFHKYYFHIDWEDPYLYDLVLNTEHFSVDMAARCIEQTAQTLKLDKRKAELEEKLQDYCLSQQVITTLVYDNHVFIEFLEAYSEKGVVTLMGSTYNMESKELAAKIAAEVEGVKEVKNEIAYVETPFVMP